MSNKADDEKSYTMAQIREIAGVAWTSAANAFRLYPDNKHTFVAFWNDFGKNYISEKIAGYTSSLERGLRWAPASEPPKERDLYVVRIHGKANGERWERVTYADFINRKWSVEFKEGEAIVDWLDESAPPSDTFSRERECLQTITMLCEENGQPIDGYRFRDLILEARQLLNAPSPIK